MDSYKIEILSLKVTNKVISRDQTVMVKINSTQGRNFKHTVSTVSVSNGILPRGCMERNLIKMMSELYKMIKS